MEERKTKKRKFRYPLWAKTLTVLVLSVFIVSIAAVTFFSNSISSITRNHYIEHSIELADTLGVYLNLDEIKVVKNKVDEIYQSIPMKDKVENSYWGEPEWNAYLARYSEVWEMPEYKSLFKQLEEFHSKNEAKSTCLCYADLENNKFVYLVDDAEEEERCLPGSFDDFTESDMTIHEHLEEGFTPEITNMPEYGYLASVARPIFDGDEVVAFALVDLSMDEIVAKEKENARALTILLISLSAGTVLIGSLMVLFLIARPIRKLSVAANEYTKGQNYELNKFEKIDIRTKDEIEDLSNSMKKMEKDINKYIVDLLGAEKKADEMKHLADKDALTGLNNKRLYFEIEERMNKEIKAKTAKFSITMIDLNDLKVINDTFGHEQGDKSIVALANAITKTYKNSETYRIGGDEFSVVSEGEELEKVYELVEELKRNLKLIAPDISAAIGVAIFDEKVDNNFEDTFKRADENMYQNKKEIKNN